MQEERLLQPYEVSRASYRCASLERKILYFGALVVQKHKDKKSDYSRYVAEFSISQMLQALGIEKYKDAKQNIIDAVQNIANDSITLQKDEKHLIVISWIQKGVYDEDRDKCILTFSEDVGRLFVECREKYSLINPHVIGSLKSFYSMRYYELALSYRGFAGKNGNKEKKWYFQQSINDLRQMFAITGYDGSQGTKNLINKVINEPIAELNAINPEFKITIEKIRNIDDRRKIDGFKFNCTACGTSSKRAKIHPGDSPARRRTKKIQNEIAEITEERAPIERAKALYTAEFARRVEEIKIKSPVPFVLALAENDAYESMKADGYEI